MDDTQAINQWASDAVTRLLAKCTIRAAEVLAWIDEMDEL